MAGSPKRQLPSCSHSNTSGAEDLSELKAHSFFSGIDWDTLRCGTAPSFLAPTPPGGIDDGEAGWDWELTSLVRDAADAPQSMST